MACLLEFLTLYKITKFLPLSKLKALEDENFNLAQNVQFLFVRVENIAGKEKMLVTSIFSFSHNVFKRLLFQGC